MAILFICMIKKYISSFKIKDTALVIFLLYNGSFCNPHGAMSPVFIIASVAIGQMHFAILINSYDIEVYYYITVLKPKILIIINAIFTKVPIYIISCRYHICSCRQFI